MSHKILLTELNIYPIKSIAGISLTSAIVEPRGLQFDRRWMITDRTYTVITQREFPRLALISVQISNDHLILNTEGMKELSVPIESNDGQYTSVQVWDDKVEAITASKEIDQWMSDALGIECHLVRMTGRSRRLIDSKYAINNDEVSFADAFPFLLISEASLADLNSRLDVPVPMNRFRPNLVVTGCEPFAEDSWKRIQIGDSIFHVVKPCARCAVTTVDQKTGIKGKEPLRTLATYRTNNGKVYFGQNVIGEGSGILKIGDIVTILD
jgi:uncharacterized protein